MSLCGARLAVPLSAAQRSTAKRQRPGIAQPAVRRGVVQVATCPRPSRPINSAPERTVRTRAVPDSATSWLTTLAPSVVVGLVTFGASVSTIVMLLRSIIQDGIKGLESQQTASISALEAKLTASTSTLQIELGKLEASNKTISKDLAANNSKLEANNSKLEALSTIVQAQQLQTAVMQGQVSVLREIFTGTPTPTPKASPPTPTPTANPPTASSPTPTPTANPPTANPPTPTPSEP